MKAYGNFALKILSLLAVQFACWQAYAQSKTEPQPSTPGMVGWIYGESFAVSDILKRLDADRDGYITRAEWERFFDHADSDGDGRLAPNEVQPISSRSSIDEALKPDEGRIAAFNRLDVNKDERIGLEEWPGNERNFRYLDADHDGVLSLEEFLSRNGRWWNEKFENLDFNRDGLIVRSEWLDSDFVFDRLDRDRNGVIERHEFYNPR